MIPVRSLTIIVFAAFSPVYIRAMMKLPREQGEIEQGKYENIRGLLENIGNVYTIYDLYQKANNAQHKLHDTTLQALRALHWINGAEALQPDVARVTLALVTFTSNSCKIGTAQSERKALVQPDQVGRGRKEANQAAPSAKFMRVWRRQQWERRLNNQKFALLS